MGYPEKTLRNEEIFRLMEAGETVYSLAEKFNLSVSRIWQIYNFVGRKKFSSLNLKYKEEKINV